MPQTHRPDAPSALAYRQIPKNGATYPKARECDPGCDACVARVTRERHPGSTVSRRSLRNRRRTMSNDKAETVCNTNVAAATAKQTIKPNANDVPAPAVAPS